MFLNVLYFPSSFLQVFVNNRISQHLLYIVKVLLFEHKRIKWIQMYLVPPVVELCDNVT